MSLQIEDLVEGETYYSEYDDGLTAIIVAKNKTFSNCEGLYTYPENFNRKNSGYCRINSFVCSKNIRKATNKEVNWLKECRKANKFIPLSEVKEDSINILNNLELW